MPFPQSQRKRDLTFSSPPRHFLSFTSGETPVPSAQTLGSPHTALLSEKCLSLPFQHHLTHSRGHPLHSARRAAAARKIASWSQPPPQLGLRPGRTPTLGRCQPVPSRPTSVRPAPSPRACALRELPEAGLRQWADGRDDRWRSCQGWRRASRGRGRAVTPPEETFPRSRQDAALGPFQSALTAVGVFQGWSLESCGCVVHGVPSWL